MPTACSSEPCARTTDATRPSTISEKYSAGPNRSAIAASGGPNSGDQERRHGAGEERADGRGGERHAGPPLPRHLVAVERGDHRRRLAGQVDQDRGRRAAVLRAVVDARQHDQRRDRRQRERDRQEHGDGRGRAEPGQHADQRAEEHAQSDSRAGSPRVNAVCEPEAEVRDRAPRRSPIRRTSVPDERDRHPEALHEDHRAEHGQAGGQGKGRVPSGTACWRRRSRSPAAAARPRDRRRGRGGRTASVATVTARRPLMRRRRRAVRPCRRSSPHRGRRARSPTSSPASRVGK